MAGLGTARYESRGGARPVRRTASNPQEPLVRTFLACLALAGVASAQVPCYTANLGTNLLLTDETM